MIIGQKHDNYLLDPFFFPNPPPFLIENGAAELAYGLCQRFLNFVDIVC